MAWLLAQALEAERRRGFRRFGICRYGVRSETPSEGLVAVGVRVRAGGGVVDPVQDDERHAAAHDQEAAEQEGGSLQGRGAYE